MASSPVSSLGSQSARKATPRRSPRPRKVTASGPQWPSSDSSDEDDDEEVRRLEAALAAAKAKKKRRSRASTPPRPELPKELFRIVVSFWRSELDGVVSDFGGNGYKVVNGTLVYDAG